MNIFKTVLAFPMFGAAAWLAWVFTVQVGVDGLPFLLAAALVTAFGAWLFGLGQQSFAPSRRIALQLALPLALIGAGLLIAPVARSKPVEAATTGGAKASVPSEPFTPERLAALRAEGRPVFVNFTAAWCVSCKANDLTSLSSRDVADAFARTGVVYLKGDWTNRDPVIAKVLAEHGQAGVPLYLVYPAGGGEPTKLPQLLTPGIVKAALEKAAA
jgi:thiol:disulfide interchange protein